MRYKELKELQCSSHTKAQQKPKCLNKGWVTLTNREDDIVVFTYFNPLVGQIFSARYNNYAVAQSASPELPFSRRCTSPHCCEFWLSFLPSEAVQAVSFLVSLHPQIFLPQSRYRDIWVVNSGRMLFTFYVQLIYKALFLENPYSHSPKFEFVYNVSRDVSL